MEKVKWVLFQFFQTIPNPKSADLVEEYKKSFPDINYKANSVENRSYCANFTAYLKKAEKELKVLGGEMAAVVEARNSFLENLSKIKINFRCLQYHYFARIREECVFRIYFWR